MTRAGQTARRTVAWAGCLLMAGLLGGGLARAEVGTRFTYQGFLEDGGQPKTGAIDLRVQAFDVATDGAPISAAPVQLESVPVAGGVFTVSLDFGDSVFLGNPVFLEIAIREDAEGGAGTPSGFTTLAPRQELTPTPYALRAASVSMDAVAGAEIANASITGADIAPASIGASRLVTSGSDGVQRRASGSCAAGQAMATLAESGAPVCITVATDVLVAAGSGLTRSRASNGAITLGLDANSGQTQVHGRCEDGQAALSAINADGSVQCTYIDAPTPVAPVAVDATGNVGAFLSVRRTTAGAAISPAVAYYDSSNRRLKYLLCNNGVGLNPCADRTPVVIDDPANDVGQFVSLAPTSAASMAYYDASAGDLKVALCDSSACTGTITVRTLDSVGDVGRHAEAMIVNGELVVVYYDATNNAYKYARCVDASCTTASVRSLTGIAGNGVAQSAVAAARNTGVQRAQFVVMAGATQVLLVSCTDADCTSFETVNLAQGLTDLGPPLSMATIRQAGLERHWIGFGRPASNRYTVQFCGEPTCSAPFPLGNQSTSSAVANAVLAPIGTGTPLLLRSTETSGSLQMIGMRSNRSFDLSANALQGTTTAGGHVDLMNGNNGTRGFYYDSANGDLMFLRCQREDCSEL